MILVTGGSGLLGSHLLLELVRKHGTVAATRRASSRLEEVRRVFSCYTDRADELFSRIEWIELDLTNYADVEDAMAGIDRVYHCAATVSFRPGDRRLMIRYNTESTANVVNACINTGVKRMLHVSSSSAVGAAADTGVPADETMIWSRSKSSTGYAISKFRSEMEVWRGMEEGLEAVIVNPTIILGPGFWDRGSSSIFARVDRGLRFATPGVTGYVGVRDVVSAMMQLMDSGVFGERFIITEGNYSYHEVFGMIAEALGKPRKIRMIPLSTLRLMARLDAFWGFFTGTRHITSEQVRAAYSQVLFSNQKIRDATGIEFTPISEVIREVAGFYGKDAGKAWKKIPLP